MSKVIIIAVVIMLVLLFLKVPVVLAVIAGSSVYFFLTPGTNSMILGQRLFQAFKPRRCWRSRSS